MIGGQLLRRGAIAAAIQKEAPEPPEPVDLPYGFVAVATDVPKINAYVLDGQNDPTLLNTVPSADEPTTTVLRAATSPNGRYLCVVHANSGGRSFEVYDFITGHPVKLPDPDQFPTARAMSCVFTPDSKYLFICLEFTRNTGFPAGSRRWWVYDVSMGSLVPVDPDTVYVEDLGGIPHQVAITNDGEYFACSTDTRPKVWRRNPSTGIYEVVPLKDDIGTGQIIEALVWSEAHDDPRILFLGTRGAAINASGYSVVAVTETECELIFEESSDSVALIGTCAAIGVNPQGNRVIYAGVRAISNNTRRMVWDGIDLVFSTPDPEDISSSGSIHGQSNRARTLFGLAGAGGNSFRIYDMTDLSEIPHWTDFTNWPDSGTGRSFAWLEKQYDPDDEEIPEGSGTTVGDLPATTYTISETNIGADYVSAFGLALVNPELSNDDYTAYAVANQALPASGKWYWEVLILVGGGGYIGLVSDSQLTEAGFGPDDADPIFYGSIGWRGDGTIWSSADDSAATQQASALLTYEDKSKLMFAFDADTGDLWIGVDGVWEDDPETESATISVSDAETWHVGLQCRDGTDALWFFPRPIFYNAPSGFSELGTAGS
jgi:hypothetical protein